jgi:UDPglucose 6-dehydrogenase
MASAKGYEFAILREAVATNQVMQDRIIEKICKLVGGLVDGKEIAVWGLTFKANTDDLRDSPSLKLVSRLLSLGAKVNCYDPAINEIPELINQALLSRTAVDSCRGAELLVVLTEWPQFASVQPIQVAEKMGSLNVFDCRNVLDRDQWLEAGFCHYGLGR